MMNDEQLSTIRKVVREEEGLLQRKPVQYSHIIMTLTVLGGLIGTWVDLNNQVNDANKRAEIAEIKLEEHNRAEIAYRNQQDKAIDDIRASLKRLERRLDRERRYDNYGGSNGKTSGIQKSSGQHRTQARYQYGEGFGHPCSVFARSIEGRKTA